MDYWSNAVAINRAAADERIAKVIEKSGVYKVRETRVGPKTGFKASEAFSIGARHGKYVIQWVTDDFIKHFGEVIEDAPEGVLETRLTNLVYPGFNSWRCLGTKYFTYANKGEKETFLARIPQILELGTDGPAQLPPSRELENVHFKVSPVDGRVWMIEWDSYHSENIYNEPEFRGLFQIRLSAHPADEWCVWSGTYVHVG